MAKYKLVKNGVWDTESSSFIPEYIGNREWRKFLQWKDEGGIPDPEYTTEELAEKVIQDNIINLKSTIRKRDRV